MPLVLGKPPCTVCTWEVVWQAALLTPCVCVCGSVALCQARPEHPALAEALKPFLALEAKVKRMARMRLSYEKLESCEDVRDRDGERMQLVVGGAAIVVVTHS